MDGAVVAMGRADDEAIDRELDRDMTASGQRQAAAARALRPSLPHKEEAWNAMVVTDSLPNALLAATVAGFNSPDQIELTRAFIDRYFESMEGIWRERTNETAQTLVNGLYPSYIIESPVIERTEKLRASGEPPSALRRLLSAGSAGVARSLRAPAADD